MSVSDLKEAVRSIMPGVIAVLTIVGYFGLLFAKVAVPDTVNLLVVAIVTFYFGSHVNGVQTAALTQLANTGARHVRSTDVTTVPSSSAEGTAVGSPAAVPNPLTTPPTGA